MTQVTFGENDGCCYIYDEVILTFIYATKIIVYRTLKIISSS